MVEGLSKRITGDWMEIGQPSLSLGGLAEYFAFPAGVYQAIGDELDRSFEQGVIEYKEGILRPLFNVLEEMKFKTISFENLALQTEDIGKLLLVTLVQRLFASGAVAPREAADDEAPDMENDLKLILTDVMALIRDNQSLKNNTAVKMILTQLAIYQRERETMQKLEPNIKDKHKAAAFRRNFQNTFQKISANIKKYYAEFIEGEAKKTKNSMRISLTRFPLRDLLSLFTKQAKDFMRIRSTIAFALEGKYKVREIFVHIFNEKEHFLALLDQEDDAYRKISAGHIEGQTEDHARFVSMAFASEIAVLIQKMGAREKEEADLSGG